MSSAWNLMKAKVIRSVSCVYLKFQWVLKICIYFLSSLNFLDGYKVANKQTLSGWVASIGSAFSRYEAEPVVLSTCVVLKKELIFLCQEPIFMHLVSLWLLGIFSCQLTSTRKPSKSKSSTQAQTPRCHMKCSAAVLWLNLLGHCQELHLTGHTYYLACYRVG